MKGYVYMIDYQNSYGGDQMECYDKVDLIKTITMIANGDYPPLVVKQVKLVKDNERCVEKPISNTLLAKIEKILKYKIETSW